MTQTVKASSQAKFTIAYLLCVNQGRYSVYTIFMYTTHTISSSAARAGLSGLTACVFLTFDRVMRCMDDQELECMYTGWQHQGLSHVAIQTDNTVQRCARCIWPLCAATWIHASLP